MDCEAAAIALDRHGVQAHGGSPDDAELAAATGHAQLANRSPVGHRPEFVSAGRAWTGSDAVALGR